MDRRIVSRTAGGLGKDIPIFLKPVARQSSIYTDSLNHFYYSCEILWHCILSRGRRNFDLFLQKPSIRTCCVRDEKIELPNPKHFHGVPKIEDAQNLWRKLQEDVNKGVFDVSTEEEDY